MSCGPGDTLALLPHIVCMTVIISAEIAITGTAGYVAIVTKLKLTPKLHILHTDVEIKLTCGLTICGVFMLVCGLFILFFTI